MMDTEACFQIMRFKIMSAALDPHTGPRLSDAYVFAWDESVYPNHSGGGFHRPFANSFRVTKGMAEELSTFLDEQWRNGTVPTFYDLEDRYRGKSKFDRMELVNACRYFYLESLFDAAFWKQLMVNHPSEASHILDKYDRGKDMYFE